MTTPDKWENIEARIKQGTLSKELAVKHLTAAIKALRSTEKAMEAYRKFVDRVGDDDRLYVAAYKIWKRKEFYKRSPLWVRANAPDEKMGADDATEATPEDHHDAPEN